jgi:hypothetical protein
LNKLSQLFSNLIERQAAASSDKRKRKKREKKEYCGHFILFMNEDKLFYQTVRQNSFSFIGRAAFQTKAKK